MGTWYRLVKTLFQWLDEVPGVASGSRRLDGVYRVYRTKEDPGTHPSLQGLGVDFCGHRSNVPVNFWMSDWRQPHRRMTLCLPTPKITQGSFCPDVTPVPCLIDLGPLSWTNFRQQPGSRRPKWDPCVCPYRGLPRETPILRRTWCRSYQFSTQRPWEILDTDLVLDVQTETPVLDHIKDRPGTHPSWCRSIVVFFVTWV